MKENNTELFRSDYKFTKQTLDNIPKEVIEKQFIINFFRELPIERLKKLINFKEIDFENKNLWGDSREDKYLYELLSQLRIENAVQYTCELKL
jgi:hypothetical protein